MMTWFLFSSMILYQHPMAPTQTSTYSQSHSVNEEDEAYWIEKLADLQESREQTFQELMKAMARGEKLAVYNHLKALLGGVAQEGSEFELKAFKVTELRGHRDYLQSRHDEMAQAGPHLAKMMGANNSPLLEQNLAQLERQVSGLAQRIAEVDRQIQELEQQALVHADQAILQAFSIVNQMRYGHLGLDEPNEENK